MRRDLVPRAAAASRFVAALGLAALAGRFAWVTIEAAMAEGDKPPPEAAAAARAAASGSAAPRGAARPPASAAPGAPVSMTLLVNVRPDRSDVRVNGRTIGSTPFVGTYPCESGEALKIEVVLAKGATLQFDRTCGPGTLQIDGD